MATFGHTIFGLEVNTHNDRTTILIVEVKRLYHSYLIAIDQYGTGNVDVLHFRESGVIHIRPFENVESFQVVQAEVQQKKSNESEKSISLLLKPLPFK